MGLSRGYWEMGVDEKHKPAAGVDDEILHVIELASHAHNVASKDANILQIGRASCRERVYLFV